MYSDEHLITPVCLLFELFIKILFYPEIVSQSINWLNFLYEERLEVSGRPNAKTTLSGKI